MSISAVQNAGTATTTATSTTLAPTWGAPTTAGNLLILAWAAGAGGSAVTATVPSGWTLLTSQLTANGGVTPAVTGALYYKKNAASESGAKTITFSNAVWAAAEVSEWSGLDASAPLDVEASATSTGAGAIDTGTTSATAVANELVVALTACNSNFTQSAPTNGFTLLDTQKSAASGAARVSLGFLYKIVSATGAQNTGVTLSGSNPNIGKIAAFKIKTTAGSAVQLAAKGSGAGANLLGGISNRTSSPNADISSKITAKPNIKLCSYYHSWSLLEPNAPLSITQSSGFNWTNFETSIETARQNGVKLILRIECGYRTPQYLYTSATAAGQPLTKLYLVDVNGNNSAGASANNVYIPLPWTSAGDGTTNANLVAHYTRLLQGIQAEMLKSDGHGGTIGDHVYFISTAMPTWVGTEMSIGYQTATAFVDKNGQPLVYDGPASNDTTNTYKAINTAEWNNYGTEANRRTYMLNAWKKCLDLHMTYVGKVPSSLALGSLFGDYSGVQSMVTQYAGLYPSRIAFFPTDLKVDVAPGGTYAGADPQGATAVQNAISAGGWAGFQSAAHALVPDTANIQAATQDGLNTYGMTFFETSEPNFSNFYNAATDGSGWIGMEALQALILAQDGGGAPPNVSTDVTSAALSVTTQTTMTIVKDTFDGRTVSSGWGTADYSGGAYTLTGTSSRFNVASGSATVAVTAAAQTDVAQLANVAMDDTWGEVQWSTDKAAVGSWYSIDQRLRYVDADNHYRVRLFVNPDNSITARVSSVLGGTVTNIGGSDANTGLSYVAGRDYRFLVSAILDTGQTTISAWAWDTTTTTMAPTVPTLQVVDTSAALQVATTQALAFAQNTGSTAGTVTFSLAYWDAYPGRMTASANVSVDASVAVIRNQNRTGAGRAWPRGPHG